MESRIIEETAQVLYRIMIDPTNPINRLKRPAKRICTLCGETYRSQVSILADSGLCADCLDVPQDVIDSMNLRIRAYATGYTAEQLLLSAILDIDVFSMEPERGQK